LANRDNPAAFESTPNPNAGVESAVQKPASEKSVKAVESYAVNVDGRHFNVTVGPGGMAMATIQPVLSETKPIDQSVQNGEVVYAPMAGNILKILVGEGSVIAEGEIVVIMEAMKMETEVRSKFAGTVKAVHVKEGGAVAGGSALVTL